MTEKMNLHEIYTICHSDRYLTSLHLKILSTKYDPALQRYEALFVIAPKNFI